VKAALEFNLPEDQIDFENATFGHRYRGILEEMDRELRDRCKYDGDEWACDAREILLEICDEAGIDLHEGVKVKGRAAGLYHTIRNIFKR
jgi:hypothetical protein